MDSSQNKKTLKRKRNQRLSHDNFFLCNFQSHQIKKKKIFFSKESEIK